MSANELKESEISALRRACRCLFVQAPEEVARDIKAKAEAVIAWAEDARRAAVTAPRGDVATTARNRDVAQRVVMSTEGVLGERFDIATRHELADRITAALDAATSSPTPAERLDCPMCNAPKSFEIDANDPALGHCFAENKSWRITDTKCSTQGCYKPRATFGDLCMDHLREAVDTQ